MARPRALLLSDVRGWAFDVSMRDGEEYLKKYFDITHGYVWDLEVEGKPLPDPYSFDVVFAQYHWPSLDRLLPWDRTVGALRARWMFPENKVRAGQREFDHVNRYRGYQVVTRANYDELIGACPRVRYVTNPVNMRRFPRASPAHSKLVVEWNGNAGHSNKTGEDVKGFYSIVLPACTRVDAKLEYAEYSVRRVAPLEMPEFYQQADVALCASLYEGASSSCLEALASGLALITTDCGNIREVHESMLTHFGESGIVIVERDVDAFVEAIEEFVCDPAKAKRLGEINRAEIEQRWSWSAWQDRYADLLRMGIRKD